MHLLPLILALLTAAAGWYYMFYSKAAHRLAGIEDPQLNRQRIRLRRIGGGTMFVLAVAFFAGFEAIDPERSPTLFVLTWLGVAVLMFIIVALALADLRLTMRMRQRDRNDL